MNNIIEYFQATSWLELTAMFFALAYVVLAARVNVLCWPAAFISTAIYSVIFFDVTLFMDSLLNVYYLVMAVYGWVIWQKSDNKASNEQHEVIQYKVSFHFAVIIGLTLLSLVVGWFMHRYTIASFPYLDSATTVFSVFATFLVAKRVVENWLYWIVIDGVSIYLYLSKSLYATALLFVIYVFIAIFGYIHWRKLIHLQYNN